MIKTVFIIISLLLSSHVYAGSVYKPKNCEYSITFPKKPKYTTSFQPALGEFISAEHAAGNKENGYFLRAECVGGLDLKDQKINTKEFLKKQIVAYVNSNGIQNAEYHFNNTKFGNSVSARGFKRIRNTMVTYKSIIYVGKTSFIMVQAGGVSSTYPQPALSKYLNSLKYEAFLTLN